jgi:hypothetical protein
MGGQQRRDLVDWLQVTATIALPVVLALTGYWFAASQAEAANRIKYIEIAVSILQSKPTESTGALREWAIEVLAKSADEYVPLTGSAKTALRTEALPQVNLAGKAFGASSATANLEVGNPK